MIELEDRILMGVPKKGRLKETTMEYLKKAGFSFYKRDRFDIALCSQSPLAFIFLPAKDIPLYVADGKVSYGITGQDMILEHELSDVVEERLKLGFGKCKLCIAAPKKDQLNAKDLIGKRIATSFPNLTKNYFKNEFNSDDIKLHEISGSVEIAPTLGNAEAIVDLVETGSTLREAGLEVIATILNTQAVLFARKGLSGLEKDWLERLERRFKGILTAEEYLIIDYNIEKNNLEYAEKITPGMKSPTVMALDTPGWVAVRSVVKRKEIYDVIEDLKQKGAQAILVSKMEYFQK